MAVHPVHARQPSLEQLSSHRRSSTVNAIRKKQIKISDPILLDNSGPSPVYQAISPTLDDFEQRTTHHRQARSLPSDSLTDLKLFQGPLVKTALPHGLDSHVHVVHKEKSRSSLTDLPSATNYTLPMESYRMTRSKTPVAAEDHPLRQHMTSSTREPKDGLLAQAFSDSKPPSHAQNRPRTVGSMPDNELDIPVRGKRRSGSIRKAFGRLFSKRDRDLNSPTRAKLSRHAKNASESGLRHGPGNLGQVHEEEGYSRLLPTTRLQGMEMKQERRSQSPIEVQPKHSLPFPMNINGEHLAPYNAKGAQGDALIAPQSPDLSHRRRATLPSIVLSPTDADALSRYWNRAPSVEPEAALERGRTPTPLIGLAITSNTTSSKRRSRSADALRDLALQQMAEGRRRSAEAQLNPWRLADQRIPEVEEADLNTPRSHHASVQEVSQLVSPREPRPSFATEHVQSSDAYETANEDARASSSDQRGSYGSNRMSVEDQTETHVDKRLSQLELNISQLEHSMQVLSGHQQAFALQKAPTSRAGVSSSQDGQELRRQQNLSSQYPTGRSSSVRYQASPKIAHARPSPSLGAVGTHFEGPSDDEYEDTRPTSFPNKAAAGPSGSNQTSSSRRHTARPITPQGHVHNFSIPYAIPKDSPTRMIDQIAPIYAALQYERAVRKQLESTVSQLQHDLLNLTTVVYEMRGLGAYPTPSPDYASGLRRSQKYPDVSPPELAQDEPEVYAREHEQQQRAYERTKERWSSHHQSSPLPMVEAIYRRDY